MTTEPATTAILKENPTDWKTFQQQLRPQETGERFPFFPLRDVPAGTTVRLEVVNGPFFEGLHGQYSLVELDVKHKGAMYRLCASGQRLASALAALEPGPGDAIALTPMGDGKSRTWAAQLG